MPQGIFLFCALVICGAVWYDGENEGKGERQ